MTPHLTYFLTKLTRNHYLVFREPARKLIEERVKYWVGVTGYVVYDIRIKDLKSRWGSCSSKGNLNFNYRLLYLPQALREYIIVHEICHLKEMNHSKRFWDLVEKYFPEYKKAIKVLSNKH